MGPENEDVERVFPEDPVRYGADNVVETGRNRALSTSTMLPMPGIQDDGQKRGALHHWTFNELCHVHHIRIKFAGETLD